ncbi:MAG: glycosyltransferase family 4 protein [Pyrinomonadaceae bacterium]
MRILQINSAKNFGGGERHLVDLIRGLTGRGHEVFLAVRPGSPIPEKLPGFPPENILEVPIKNALDLFAVRRLIKFIRAREIEIVHAHTGKDYLPASLAVRAARDVRLVITRHVLFPLKKAQKITLKNVSRAIAVSSGVEANLRKTFPPERIVVVPNGIDAEKRAGVDRETLRSEFRFENNIPFDAPVLGTVGELKHLKGQQDFILAAQEVAKRHAEARFIIVGKDNSYGGSFRRELKRLVKVFDLEERFIWFDWIEDTRPLLSALDLFVSPSHSESFGLAILEAMASGCAVVSTETEGAKGLIENGKSGLLTPIKEPIRLANVICEILEDKEKLKNMGGNARTRARENFGLERMVEETEKVYRNIER